MTIPKMAFGVKCVRDFLASNGCVFTVRGFDYRTTAAVVPELGDIMVTRRKVCEITAIDDLTGFLSMSGFNTVSEWWVQIRRFCKGSMYLYLIKITDTWLSREEQDNEKQTQQRVLTEQNAWSKRRDRRDNK